MCKYWLVTHKLIKDWVCNFQLTDVFLAFKGWNILKFMNIFEFANELLVLTQ